MYGMLLESVQHFVQVSSTNCVGVPIVGIHPITIDNEHLYTTERNPYRFRKNDILT